MPKKQMQNKKRSLISGKSPYRKPGNAIAISKLLARDTNLHNMGAIASAQQQWLAWAREQLPAELAPRLVQVVVKGGELTAYAESSAWCERLRYAAEGLLAGATVRD